MNYLKEPLFDETLKDTGGKRASTYDLQDKGEHDVKILEMTVLN